MVGRSKCFVPGCSTSYESDRDKSKAKGKKDRSLFKAQEKYIEYWRKAIPRADKELTLVDCVCELHFQKDDIERYFEFKLADGSLFKLPRKKPKLKEGAVPYFFPNMPRDLSKPTEKGKPPVVESPRATKVCGRTQEIPGENSCEGSFTNKSPVKEFTFDYLVKNLNNVLNPNHTWGVTYHKDFLVCAKWAGSYAVERKVIIDSDLNIKVFLRAVDANITMKKPSSVDDVSDILKIVDSYTIHGD